MDAYGKFASLYDKLMQDVPYKEIADLIDNEIKTYNVKNKIVLDLACGTGTLTNLLLEKGYEMIGADGSIEMLNVAKGKNKDILYLNQSMEELELFGTVGTIYSTLDSFNYLSEDGALDHVLNLCNNYLEPDGLLIFDINTEFKFKNILANNVFTYDNDDIFYVWENEFLPDENICNFYLTFFSENEAGLYERFDEFHTERIYKDREICKALKRNGFTVLKKYDGFSNKKAHKKSERIFYVCKNTDSIQLKNAQ